MNGPVALPGPRRLPWRQRPAIWLAIGAARVFAGQPPGRIRWLLYKLRRADEAIDEPHPDGYYRVVIAVPSDRRVDGTV